MEVSAIQIINTVLNVLGALGLIVVGFISYDYRRRLRLRQEDLNKRLDHLLILTHELYQSELSNKRTKEKLMKYKNRDVFVIRPIDQDRVVIQEVQTGSQENVRKDQIEGYTEEFNSKEVKTGQALNAGDQDSTQFEKDKKEQDKINAKRLEEERKNQADVQNQTPDMKVQIVDPKAKK